MGGAGGEGHRRVACKVSVTRHAWDRYHILIEFCSDVSRSDVTVAKMLGIHQKHGVEILWYQFRWGADFMRPAEPKLGMTSESHRASRPSRAVQTSES